MAALQSIQFSRTVGFILFFKCLALFSLTLSTDSSFLIKLVTGFGRMSADWLGKKEFN